MPVPPTKTPTPSPTNTPAPMPTIMPETTPTPLAVSSTWQVYVTNTTISTDDVRDGWKRVLVTFVIENLRNSWVILDGWHDIQGTLTDSGGYERDLHIFYSAQESDMAIPPFFRVARVAEVEIPEIYSPTSELVVQGEGPFPLDLESPVTNLAMPFDEVPPGLIADVGHVIEIPNDRRVIVQDVKLSNLCNYNMAPSEAGCIFLTLELENISGDDIAHSSQNIYRAMIDDRGYHTGLSWYTVNEDKGIWDGDWLAPGRSESGVLVTRPLYGFDEIQTAWAIIAVRRRGVWTGWTLIEARK